MGDRSAPDLEISPCDARSTRGDHDGGYKGIAMEPGVETVLCGRRILAGSGQSVTPPRRICAAHGGRLSLLRATKGARVVGYGSGGRGSGNGGSHSCWVAAGMLVDGR